MLENREKEGTVYTKNHIDPMLAVAPLENDPKADAVAEEAKVSAETFQEHSKMAQLVVSTDEMAEYNGDLTTLKNEVIAKVVTQAEQLQASGRCGSLCKQFPLSLCSLTYGTDLPHI